ncbi:MAG: hypothetical protein ABI573_10225 [Chloroflexota bacterium]
MDTIGFERRRPLGGAALLCLAVILAGCGPLLPPVTGSPTPSVAVSSQGPAAQLTDALGNLRAGYTFDTTLRVADKDAAHVTGRWYAGSSEIAITSGGATVTYRVVPPGAWIQDDAGVWAEAEAPTTTGDPLSILLAPTSVTTATGAGAGQLVAMYPATALGLPGTDPISVTFSIGADGTITARYDATTDAGLATSETTLKAASAQDPIIAPSLLPAASG